MARVCLLDFDGVILRKHQVHSVVQKRCEAYVAKKLKLGPKEAALVNRQLYESCGHTVVGLGHMGLACDVDEFNKYVYHGIDYKAAFEGCFEPTDPTVLDVVALLQRCGASDCAPFVFSNAPDYYCSEILHYMGKSSANARRQLSNLHVLSTGNSEIGKPLLKPCVQTYDAVNELLGVYPGNGKDNVLFVDDKLINLMPATRKRVGWSCFLFDSAVDSDCSTQLNGGVRLVGSLTGVVARGLSIVEQAHPQIDRMNSTMVA